MVVLPSTKPWYVWWVCRTQWWVWQAGRCVEVLLLVLLFMLSVSGDVIQGEVCLMMVRIGGSLVDGGRVHSIVWMCVWLCGLRCRRDCGGIADKWCHAPVRRK
jgi:hypothetical protein